MGWWLGFVSGFVFFLLVCGVLKKLYVINICGFGVSLG